MRAASDERWAKWSNVYGQRRIMRSASRRDLLRIAASASLWSFFPNPGWAEDAEEQAIPFLDAEKVAPAKGGMLNWNELKDWVIPTKDLYHVSHYGVAQVKE